jgi:hypothetical protein
LAALAPEDKADPAVDEVYLSGERQRPADPEAVSLRAIPKTKFNRTERT